MPAPDKPISAAGPVRPAFAAQVFCLFRVLNGLRGFWRQDSSARGKMQVDRCEIELPDD